MLSALGEEVYYVLLSLGVSQFLLFKCLNLGPCLCGVGYDVVAESHVVGVVPVLVFVDLEHVVLACVELLDHAHEVAARLELHPQFLTQTSALQVVVLGQIGLDCLEARLHEVGLGVVLVEELVAALGRLLVVGVALTTAREQIILEFFCPPFDVAWSEQIGGREQEHRRSVVKHLSDLLFDAELHRERRGLSGCSPYLILDLALQEQSVHHRWEHVHLLRERKLALVGLVADDGHPWLRLDLIRACALLVDVAQNQLDLLVVLQVLPNIAEVNKLHFSIEVGLLVAKLKNFSSLKEVVQFSL